MPAVTLQELHAEAGAKKFPRFRAGQTVKVHQRIKEGDKERIQIFQGLVIETTGGTSICGSITVRKIVDGIGVEKVFPLHLPSIEKIELVKEGKVRQARIFFMRDRQGKSARLQERFFSDAELKAMAPHEATEAEIEEAIKAEEARQKAEAEQAADEV